MTTERVEIPKREHRVYSIEPFFFKIRGTDWGSITEASPRKLPYRLRIMTINSGERVGFSDESGVVTLLVDSGAVTLGFSNKSGKQSSLDMEDGVGYTLDLSNLRGIRAQKNSKVFELSTLGDGKIGEKKLNDVYVMRPFKIEKPWGSEEHFTPQGIAHMLKILYLANGEMNSLQWHDMKQESWILRQGKVTIKMETETDGEMIDVKQKTDCLYTCDIEQEHRLIGVGGGGSVWEFSTAEIGNTWRVEDKYSRGSVETEKDRILRDLKGKRQ